MGLVKLEGKVDVLDLESGKALDYICVLARGWRVFDWTDETDGGLDLRMRPEGDPVGLWSWEDGPRHRFSPSVDIADAWPLHEDASQWLFSERRRYLKALDRLLCLQTGQLGGKCRGQYEVAYPDALIFLSPEVITKAYIIGRGLQFWPEGVEETWESTRR
jgi:hypothetical protein